MLCLYYFSKILASISIFQYFNNNIRMQSVRDWGGGGGRGGPEKKIVARSRVYIILHFCHVNFDKVCVNRLERKFCQH